jgi:hypothetical protein
VNEGGDRIGYDRENRKEYIYISICLGWGTMGWDEIRYYTVWSR